MRASLIIAAHNESDRLWRTVASCLETSAGLDCEIIVADDASWDGSVEEMLQRFPQVRVVQHDKRKGASPTKDLGARQARGDVLIFLDGHTKPEPGAIQRLIEDVERLNGDAIVTPAVTGLNVTRWKTQPQQMGHGYSLELERLDCAWLPLKSLREHPHRGRLFYESPALIGCAFAVHRELYDDLRGFDPHMLCWGVEDLDFGLKSWLMGHPILHDPEPVIGHRFQQRFDNFDVPVERLVVNQLRLARKNFTDGVWNDWLARCRERNSGPLAGYPEGLWARVWQLFGELRPSAEQERAHLLARRVHDEFWYAERFGLTWPKLQAERFDPSQRAFAAAAAAEPSPSPSPSPSPPPEEPEPPEEPPCDEPNPDCCDCGCSPAPVRYFNGQIRLDATDLTSAGFGATWQHRRVYCNQLSAAADWGQGYNWLVFQWPNLVEHQDGSLTVIRGTQGSLWFDRIGEGYRGRFGTKSTLEHDLASHRFRLTLPSGTRVEFHDFDQLDFPAGHFARQVEPGGAVTQVTEYTAGDLVAEIQRSGTVGGTTLTEAFVYAYTEAGQVRTATLRRQLARSNWEDVRRAVYDYYGPESGFGSAGDLERVRRQVPTSGGWGDVETDYYRYWLAADEHGFQHGLKFVVKPATYVRLQAAGHDPLTVSNAVLSMFADLYFEYDAEDRVIQERIDGGSRTFAFSFTEGVESTDYNVWARKTVETLPDGDQTIVYTNRIGQFLVKELRSGAQRWIDASQYDANGRQTRHARPSAVIGYNEAFPDLQIELRPADGLIELTDYYAGSGNGAAPGYVAAEKLQRGSGGTPVVLRRFEYAFHTAGGVTVYKVSKQTAYRNEDGTGAIETSFGQTFHAGTTQVQQRTTTLPVVPTDQNGSGVAAMQREYFDSYGNLTWSMDERGFIAHHVYDLATGARLQEMTDVNTSVVSGAPSGWTTPTGGGLNLVTDFESDDQGRMTQTLGPTFTISLPGAATAIRAASWIVHDDVNHVTYAGQGFAFGSGPDYSYKLIDPVSITKMDAGGRVNEQIQATAPSTSGTLSAIIAAAGGGNAAFPQSSYTRWTTNQYTDCCLAASQRVYHTIPSSSSGSSGTNYDETDYGYDVMKRRNRTATPGGTITDVVYDPRRLVLKTYLGTNDDGATETDPTGGGADPDNNMKLVATNEFDNGQAGGDGNLTRLTQSVNATITRVTLTTYDFRNRPIAIDGEIDFFQQDDYDNLDRVIRADRRDTSASGNLIERTEFKYDNRGSTYRTIRYGVDPPTGIVGNSLSDNTWFDAAINVIKSLPAGSKLFVKTTYDSLGRPTVTYKGYDLDETTYAEALSVTDDVILEQVETTYDHASNAIQTTTRQRYHDAPAAQTGPLQNPSATPKARVTYQTMYPDALGRTVASVEYGTNGGATFTRPDTVPARSDTVRVRTVEYDAARNALQATDPKGMVTRFEHDDRGREITRIENHGAASSPGSSCDPSDDVNRTTRTTYTPDDMRATLVAENSRTGNQTTTWTYGTTLADSDIASSQLLRSVTYPDSTGGSDLVRYSHNRQGEQTTLTDQRGCVHTYDRDQRGRLIHDRVTTLGSGVDGAVRRLSMSYEVRGMTIKLTSYDNATVGSGSVVNECLFAFNSFRQLIADAQSHSGAVNTSTTPKVQYGYANGSANTIRPTTLTYPNGRVLTYDYGTADGIDDACSRVASLIDDDAPGTHLADYSLLGLGATVVVDYTEPDVKYTLVDLSGANDPDTGDIYSGLDRFGRIKDCRWHDYGNTTDTVRLKYGYDRASNRLWRADLVAQSLSKDFDELYAYDGLHRLKDMQRGLLNGSNTAVTNQTFGQCWSLDPTSNWHGFREAATGGSSMLVQSRTANKVNEITGITNSTGPTWTTPAYDAAGNTTTLPQPADPTKSYTATYDAWNRLVRLEQQLLTPLPILVKVSENQYDARNFRTVRMDYTLGVLATTRHFYYTHGWQSVEERLGSSSSPNRQFVWGPRYIDDLVLRDCDTNNNGTLDERLYGLQDANWNMAALIDTSATAQERYLYSPFGWPTILNGMMSTIRTSSTVDIECLFTGQRFDPTTKLHLFRNRWFESVTGRFITRDPLMYPNGPNASAGWFVPGRIDPSGLCTIELWCWPAVGGWLGNNNVHCEYNIKDSIRGNGRCRSQLVKCPTLYLKVMCDCQCLGAAWQSPPPPMPPGAFLAQSVATDESKCDCLRKSCKAFPVSSCYVLKHFNVSGHGNSNTGASCLNAHCGLGIPNPPVAPPLDAGGWGFAGGCPAIPP